MGQGRWSRSPGHGRGEWSCRATCWRGDGWHWKRFPAIEAAAWTRAVDGRAVKEVTLRQVGGTPVYEAHLAPVHAAAPADAGQVTAGVPLAEAGSDRPLIEAETLAVRKAPFDTGALVSRLAAAAGVPVAETALLESYDGYYYGRPEDAAPLPVVRVGGCSTACTASTSPSGKAGGHCGTPA